MTVLDYRILTTCVVRKQAEIIGKDDDNKDFKNIRRIPLNRQTIYLVTEKLEMKIFLKRLSLFIKDRSGKNEKSN